jgi:hypothetical protein
MSQADPIYWKRKLAAYLHDSPEKVLSIVDHEQRARRIAGENFQFDEVARKDADWAASAADRLPFPPSCQTVTELSCFKHPMGGAVISLNEDKLPVGLAEENSQVTRPRLTGDDPRAEFIATWRFWRNWASSRHRDFALYPAETRLSDHTIWNHLAITSAMQGCFGGSFKDFLDAKNSGRPTPSTPDKPCFLLFTIGPVQEFIAQARSTRDLWSGSYLLSYLIASVLRRIALDFGPDHAIFPNLCDQPLVDLLLKDEIWDKASTTTNKTLAEAFGFYGDVASKTRLLTPSLPNRFLAVLPSAMVEHQERGSHFASAEVYAEDLARGLRKFLQNEIAERVKTVASEAFASRFDAERFDRQVESLLDIHWQILPWPDTFEASEALASALPSDSPEADYTPRAGLAVIRDLCEHGADTRYLGTDTSGKPTPRNVAAAWSALYSLSEWMLDGTKSNRGFAAPSGASAFPGKQNTKDSLNGRDEAVLIVDNKDDAEKLSAELEKVLEKEALLKAGECLAAGSLIKRLWPFACLCKVHSFVPGDLAMPNTRSIAAGEPWGNSDDDDVAALSGEKYFAVLALDGDSIGKWISGSKTPKLSDMLSEKANTVYRQAGANQENRRPLSPSWHLQFSEALGNFSLHAARRIVESFDGRLIYAGGDDVLAMLPSDTAVECAEALRLAFRGSTALNQKALGQVRRTGNRREDWKSDGSTPLFAIEHEGFLKLHQEASGASGASAGLLDEPVNFPAILPGPSMDCSVGIAIAHFKSPLQDVVRAAQAAEKRAKNKLGRAAVAMSVMKRSGEITEWGCQWGSGGLELYEAIVGAMKAKAVSTKFPHRVCQLLEPYRSATSDLAKKTVNPIAGFPVIEVIEREFRHALERQAMDKHHPSYLALAEPELLRNYLVKLERYNPSDTSDPTEHSVTAMIGLCTTVAFAHRTQNED